MALTCPAQILQGGASLTQYAGPGNPDGALSAEPSGLQWQEHEGPDSSWAVLVLLALGPHFEDPHFREKPVWKHLSLACNCFTSNY